MNNEETKPSVPFLRALIKATHPEWSEDQIMDEVKKKLEQKEDDNEGCEYCSG